MSRDERVVGLWGGVAFGFVLASYSAFRPIRDSVGLGGADEKVKWMFLISFVATLLASVAWSAILSRAGRRRSVPVAMHVFSGCLMLFGGLLSTSLDPVMTGHAFYIWAAVFNLFVVSVLWSLFADLLGFVIAKRVYGLIAAGGSLGSIFGPELTRSTVEYIGIPGVLFTSAVLLQIGILCIGRVKRLARALPDAIQADDRPLDGGPFHGIASVLRSRYLLAIVGFVLCTAIAATFMYLEQRSIAYKAFPDDTERTKFFATIDLFTNIGTFVVQVVGTGYFLRRLGPAVLLFALPVAQLVGITTVVLVPSLAVLVVVQVLTRVVTHGINRPARELLFTVVSTDDKYRAKNAIDTAGYRLGDVVGSFVSDGMKSLGAGTVVLLGALGPLTLVWFAIAWALGRGFKRRASDAQADAGRSPTSG
jgi:AAA family ATP:ADP antiporter